MKCDKKFSIKIQSISIITLIFILFFYPYETLASAHSGSGPIVRHRISENMKNSDPIKPFHQETSIEGWLSALWSDPAGNQIEPSYFLSTLSGERYSLDFLNQENFNLQRYPLIGKYIQVDGMWDSELSIYQVFKVQEVTEPFAMVIKDELAVTPNWIIDNGKITGNTPWITILCKFSDVPDEPKPLEFFKNMYRNAYPGLDHYWQEASYGVINLTGSTAAGWYTMPSTAVSYYDGYGNLNATKAYDDCIGAADAEVDFSKFYGVNLMFNALVGYYAAGYGSLGYYDLEGENRYAGITWTFPGAYGDLSVLVHEMGHGYAFPHSFINNGTFAYGNVWDVMSDSGYNCTYDPNYGCLPQHTIASNKNMRGWLEDANVLTITAPTQQTITLERTTQPTNQNYRMVNIIVDELTSYTLEARKKVGYDLNLPGDAVIIHRFGPAPRLIDLDNDGDTADEEAMWKVGETYVDSQYPISFVVSNATPTGFEIQLTIGQMPRFTNCASQSHISTLECEALVTIYNEMNGPNWGINFSGWLVNSNPCDWFGVRCSNNHVHYLYLYTVNGTIPPEIGNLQFLSYLGVVSEYLTGEIPSEMGALVNITELYLGYNLSGEIPGSLANLSKLNTLSLFGNKLSGKLPPELGNLTSLEYLHLSGNQLSGNIPIEFGNLSSLKQFNLSKNRLEGSIPNAIGNLSNLNVLVVDNNKLTGEVPTSILQLNQLRNLNLDNNALKTSNSDVLAFINTFTPNWQSTQTYPPSDVTGYLSPGNFQLQWDPKIFYYDSSIWSGYYEISYASVSDQVWKIHGVTENKRVTSYQINNLDRNQPYYFRIRTFTSHFNYNQNDLWSEYSPVITIDPSLFSFLFMPTVIR
jgi:M6 family metalloprotease-like protein